MKNSNRNIRMRERRVGYRKKEQTGSRLLLPAMVAVIAVLVFHIRDIKAELEEMRTALKRIEVLEYGRIETSVKTYPKEETDYVSSIAIMNVEKPVQRTRSETIQRLEELGKENPEIAAISRSSSQYPEAMLTALANNPEMADFVAGYLRDNKYAAGGLTELEKEQECPLLLQWDSRWGYELYGGDSCIGLAGCGPTCLSMILYYLTRDETLTPDRIAAYSMENDYYVSGTGTAWGLMEDFPEIYGIKATEPRMTERSIKAELDKGKVLICAMGQGDFTVSGHFIVIYGYGDSGFQINDPNCVARSRKEWTFEEIKDQVKKIWAYGK
ncbi:MAG: hypothetical protein HDR01_03895 [Lachnospiraceae bacterium]|nr:hypothetical protein [Lachnospiraceae bacterium]